MLGRTGDRVALMQEAIVCMEREIVQYLVIDFSFDTLVCKFACVYVFRFPVDFGNPDHVFPVDVEEG